MIYKRWWKILGVLLLGYAFTVGLLVPLKSGVVSVTPTSGRTSDTLHLEVLGYNSNYQSGAEGLRAWLKLDDERALGAQEIIVANERQLQAVFRIPAHLPTSLRVQDFTLVIDNSVDGPAILPSAVFITQDSLNPALGEEQWTNAPITTLHAGPGFTYPFRNILGETIRNTYFHVPLWFGMIFLFLFSVIYSVGYLRGYDPDQDFRAQALTQAGILFGMLGLLTGAIWAKHTWGAYWSWDVKQNMTAIALLIYFAYFILRYSFEDPEKSARLAAVYNIFAFATLIPLIYVIPRLTDSLHPGSGGNPAFGSQDLDNTMRLVFYPAVIGWTLLGFWVASLVYRARRLEALLWER